MKEQVRSFLRTTCIAAISMVFVASSFAKGSTQPSGANGITPNVSPAQASDVLAKASLEFVENKGQVVDTKGNVRNEIKFSAHSKSTNVYFLPDRIMYAFTKTTGKVPEHGEPFTNEMRKNLNFSQYRMDLELVGANSSAHIVPNKQFEGVQNFYTSNTGTEGISGVRSFGKLVYENVYSNIDMVLVSNGKGMKSEYVVRPGGNASNIVLNYAGADKVEKSANGGYTVTTPMGTLSEQAPFSYIMVDGKQVEVPVTFEVEGTQVKFNVPSYDKSQTLVIDPTFDWGSFIGGTGEDVVNAIASQRSGFAPTNGTTYIWVCGYTATYAAPWAGVGFGTGGGSYDAFVAAYTYGGTSRVFATRFGSNNTDFAYGVTVDASGNAYVCGEIGAADAGFATGGVFQTAFQGDVSDGFIASFNSTGSRIAATFVGSSGEDHLFSIALDGSGNLTVGGYTGGSTLGTTNTFSGILDGIVIRFNTALTTRTWGTFIGTANDTYVTGVANVANTGEVYIGGFTRSNVNIATTGSHSAALNNNGTGTSTGTVGYDGFVAHMTSAGARDAGTYLGGADNDRVMAVAYDGINSRVIAVGWGNSVNTGAQHIATIGGGLPQSQVNGNNVALGPNDGWIVRMQLNAGSPSTLTRNWGTFWGSASEDKLFGVWCDDNNVTAVAPNTAAVGSGGRYFVAGQSNAAVGSFLGGLAGTFTMGTNNTNQGLADGVWTQLSPGAATTVYELSATTGTDQDDGCYGITVDNQRNVHVGGYAIGVGANNIGISGPQTTSGGGANEGFSVKFCDLIVPNQASLTTSSTPGGTPGVSMNACSDTNRTATGSASTGAGSGSPACLSDLRNSAWIHITNAVQGVLYTIRNTTSATVVTTTTATSDGNLDVDISSFLNNVAIFPGPLATGVTYTLRVDASTSSGCTENGAGTVNIVIYTLPTNSITQTAPAAASPAGTGTFGNEYTFVGCANAASTNTYQVTSNAGHTYSWCVYPTGLTTSVGPSNTNSLNVVFANVSVATTCTLRVRETNSASGCGKEYIAYVRLLPLMSMTAGTVNNAASAGANGTSFCSSSSASVFGNSSAYSTTSYTSPAENLSTFWWTTSGASGVAPGAWFTASIASPGNNASGQTNVNFNTATYTTSPATINMQLSGTNNTTGLGAAGTCVRTISYPISIFPQPVITSVVQSTPAGGTNVCDNGTMTFTVTVTYPGGAAYANNPITYNATINRSNITGGTASPLGPTNVTTSAGGTFTINVADVGAVTSAYDNFGQINLSVTVTNNSPSAPVGCTSSAVASSAVNNVSQKPDAYAATAVTYSNANLSAAPGGTPASSFLPATGSNTSVGSSPNIQACSFDGTDGYGQQMTLSVAAAGGTVNAGGDFYVWSIPAGGTIIGSAQGVMQTSVVVQWTSVGSPTNRTLQLIQYNDQNPATAFPGGTATACNTTSQWTVSVKPLPPVPTLTFASTVLCEGATVTLNITGGPANGTVQLYNVVQTPSAGTTPSGGLLGGTPQTVALNASGAGSFTYTAPTMTAVGPSPASTAITIDAVVSDATTVSCGRRFTGGGTPIRSNTLTVFDTPAAATISGSTTICPGVYQLVPPATNPSAPYTYTVTGPSIGGIYPVGTVFRWDLRTNAGVALPLNSYRVNSVTTNTANPLGVTGASINLEVSPTLAGQTLRWFVQVEYPVGSASCILPYAAVSPANDIFVSPPPTPNISSTTPPITPICAGSTVTYQTTLVAGNTYSWVVVPFPGTFPGIYPPGGSTAIPAGTAPTTTGGFVLNGNTFTVNWGTWTPTVADSFRVVQVQVIEQNPAGCRQSDTADIRINPLPDATVAQAVNTPGGPCVFNNENSHIVAYSVPKSPGYTIASVAWTISGGGAIYSYTTSPPFQYTTSPHMGTIAGANDTLRVQWYSTGAQTVSATVTTTNGCVTGPFTLSTFVYPVPNPVISGPASVCKQKVAETATYNVNPNVAGDNYTWEIIPSSGGTFSGASSGVGVVSVNVNWSGPANTTYTLRCTQVSAMGCTARTTFDVVVNPNPVPVVSGPSSVCANSVVTFSTQNNAPNNSYVWTLVGGSGNSFVGGINNTAAVQVNTGTSNFSINVLETVLATSCATQTANSSVTVQAAPNPAITRTSPATGNIGAACTGTSYTYQTTPASGVTYQWSLNGTPLTGETNATHTRNWSATGTNTLSVTVTLTSTQCSTTVNQVVVVSNPPAPSVSGPNQVCGGGATPTVYTYSTPLTAGNSYSWSASGGIGTVSAQTPSSGVGVNTWSVTFSGSTTTKNITVVESDPNTGCVTTSAAYAVTATQKPNPVIAPASAPVCQNSTGNQYNITATRISGSTIAWSVTGGTITAGQGTDVVTVTWTTAGTGTVSVTETNGICSASNAAAYAVVVNAAPTSFNVTTTTPNVCALGGSGSNVTTAIINLSGSQTGVNYALFSGASFIQTISGTGSPLSWSVTPAPNTPGVFNYSVVATNTTTTCTATMNGTASVTLNANPTPSVSGTASVCVGSTFNYTTASSANRTWAWTVPGGTINSGQGSNTVNVTWGNTAGTFNITVLETNTVTGCGATSAAFPVSVGASPAVLTVSPTATAVCFGGGTNVTVTLTGGSGQSGVTYDLMEGTSVLSTFTGVTPVTFTVATGTGTTQLNVGSHTLAVRATGSTPCTTPVMMNGNCVVTVNARPNPIIAGPLSVCSGSTQTYSVSNNAGSSYAWTVSGTGVSIVGTTNTASISVLYSASATTGTINVTETNAAGCIQLSAPTSVTVTVNTTPTPTITAASGNFTPCQNVAQTYTTPVVAGATYAWTVSAGGNITGGQGSTSVGVTWTGNGAQSISVVVTSGASCIGSVSQVITVSPQPTVYNVTTSTPNLCNTTTLPNAIINVSGSQSGVNYQLFRGATGLGTLSGTGSPLQFTDNTYGGVGTFNYTVVATSGAGCVQNMSGTATVTVNPLPNSTISGNATVCSGTSQVYSVTASGSQTYNWTVPTGWTITGGQGTNAVTATAGLTGSISVVVTNTATTCNNTGTFAVTVSAAPTVFNVTPTVGAVCLGNGTTIGLSGSTSGVTYTVMKGSQTIVTPVAGTGLALNISIPASALATVGNHIFTITAVGASPCNTTVITMNGSLTVTVNPLPTPVISGPLTACINQAVTYSTPASGNNYSWSVTGGVINGPATSNSVSVTFTGSPGTRSVQVVETNPNTGCFQSAVLSTIQANATPAPSVTPGPTQTVCASATVTYSTTNNVGNTYNWTVVGAGGAITGGQGSSSINVLWGSSAGTGVVTVTETAGGCSNSASSTVTVNALPIAYNVATTTPGVCVTGNAQITLSNSQAGFVYTLIRNGSAQAPTVTGTGGLIQFTNSLSVAGTYGYTISATGAGCTNLMNGTATVIATNPPTPTINGAATVCANTSSTYTVTPANGGSTYSFQVTGAGNTLGVQSGNQQIVNWGTNSGVLSVIETDVAHCIGSTSFAVSVTPLPTAQTVTLAPTSVCAGGGLGSNSTTATVGLANSQTGYTYELLSAANNVVRTATGTGAALSFSPVFTNLSPGTITWTVRAISNTTPACTTAAMANSVTLTVVPNPTPAVTGPTTPCQNATVTYQTTNNTGATYAWNIVSGTGSFTPTNTYQTSGTWTSTGAASIRVVETNAAGCSQENILSVNVTTAPTPTITANPSTAPVCGLSTVTYSTTAVGSTYAWTVGSGGTLNSGQNTNSIVVTWANSTPGASYSSGVNLTVSNGGCSGSTSMAITVTPQPVPVITGDAARCSGQTGNYTTPFLVSGRNYTWSISPLPPGMSFSNVSGTNVNAIAVNWVNTGTVPFVATVQVVETANVGTCSGVATFNVTVNPLPVVTITGPNQVCQNSVVSYTATPTQNGLSYAWNVTGANSFTGQGTGTIGVSWGTTNGNIQLTVTNTATGCTNTATNNNLAITVTATPTPTIATPPGTTSCAGSTVTYNVLNPSGLFTYSWANTGATSASTPAGNSYTVTWPNTPGNGTITLTATTVGGVTCIGSTTRNVTIAPNPAPSISGQTAVCPNQDITYTTPFVANDLYNWTLPAGTFIVTGGSLSGNTVTVRWNSPGTTAATRTVTVTETSQNGCVGVATVTVTVNPAPIPVVAGNTNTCGYMASYDGVPINNVETYTVTNPVSALSVFQWSLPGGGGTFTSSSSGVNVTQVTVQWNEPTTSASITRVLRVQETTNSIPNCTGQTDVNVQVNWNAKPAITGSRTVCSNWQYAANSTNAQMYTPYTYVTPGLNQTINPPASAYVWDVRDVNNVSILTGNPATTTPGARITGSGNQVQVEYFNPTNAPVTMVLRVTETISYSNALQVPSVKACPVTDTFVVVVNPLPKPVISPAPTDVCGRATAVYATAGDATSSFLWTTSTGSIVGANNANSVTITWNDVTTDNTPGFVQVSQTFNATACSTTVRQNVNVDVTPTPVITGPTVLCQGTTNGTNQGTYSVVTQLANRAYLWSIDSPTSGPVVLVAGPNNLATFQVTVSGNTTIPVNAVIRLRETSTAATNNGATGGAGCFAETTFNVTLNPNPTPVITSSTGGLNVNGVCAGSSHTYATALNSGNTYSWTVVGGSVVGTSTANSVNILWGAAGAGSISVRERVGAAGCYTDVTSNIIIRPLPTPDLTNQTGGVNAPAVCALSTTVYTTPNVSGNTYVWSVNGGTISGGQNTNIISVTWGAAGTGSVTVTETTPASLGSCSASRTLNITINPLPTPAILGPPSPPVCINSTQTYTTALTAGRTYLWGSVVGGNIVGANNTNTVNVNWTAAGNGSLTVTETITATNCSASATRVIPVNALPIVTITPSGTTNLCVGQTVTLAATDGFVTYTWNTGETTPRITVRQAGTYSVTVVDGNGCQNTSTSITVTVNSFSKPTISINGTASFCEGESRTLTAVATGGTPLAYRWNTGATTSSINVSTSGVYNVEITYSNSCKILSDDMTITVSAKPTAAITAGGPTKFCEGGNVVLDAGAGFVQYAWMNGTTPVGTSRTLQVRTSGSYTVTVTNAGGCSGTSTPTVVTVNPNPIPTIAVTGNLAFCQGDSVKLDAGTGYRTYAWSPGGATTQSIVVKVGGSYSVTVTDTNGCTGQSGAKTVTVFPTPQKPGITRIGNIMNVDTANKGYTAFQWKLNDNNISGATSYRHDAFTTGLGLYRVTITDRNGCSNISDPIRIDTVLDVTTPTVLSQNLGLYPNPTSGNLTLKLSLEREAASAVLSVRNLIGSEVLTLGLNDLVVGDNVKQLDLSHLPSGIYYVEVLMPNGNRMTARITKVD